VLYTVSTPPGMFILGNPNLPPPQDPRPALASPTSTTPHTPSRRAATPCAQENVRVVALYLKLGDEGARDGTMLVQVARSGQPRRAGAAHPARHGAAAVGADDC
jgi:two-component system sensor histidine kinase TctE